MLLWILGPLIKQSKSWSDPTVDRLGKLFSVEEADVEVTRVI